MALKARFDLKKGKDHYFFIYEGYREKPLIPKGLEEFDEVRFGSGTKFPGERLVLNKNVLSGQFGKGKDEYEEKEGILKFPKSIDYSDVTDEPVFGYRVIQKNELISKGLWAFMGERNIRFDIDGFAKELTDNSNIDCSYSLKLVKVENENLDKEIISNKEFDWKDKIKDSRMLLDISLDTTELGSFEVIKDYLDKEGYADLEFDLIVNFEENDIDEVWSYGFPFKLKLVDPAAGLDRFYEIAAVDFGTSSTCIAINRDGNILLSLEKEDDSSSKKKDSKEADSEEEKREANKYNRKYENPTNIGIRDWEKFYEMWKTREEKAPLPGRYEKIIERSDAVYAQGYKLNKSIKNANYDELQSIITQLKMIPYHNHNHNIVLKDKKYLFPYNTKKDGIRKVELISEYKDQDETSFDPISFYSYLLGRIITSPLNEKIITKFYVTMPVKFTREVKESMLNSIKSGLILAYPKTLKDRVEVNEGYEEPVAFVGAICKNPKVNEQGWGVGSKFAVFDFGGGTVDFAFGKYRDADENNENEEDYDKIIEIINTSGKEGGGAEYILHKISYLIYEENKDLMKEFKIPFIVPEGEKEIDSDELLSGNTEAAVYNVKMFNEKISREIFEGTGQIEADNDASVEYLMKDSSNKDINVELTMPNDLEEKLTKILEDLVEAFDKLIKENFGKDAYKNLHIFKAGNASRSKILENIFNKKYPEEKQVKIHFIDENLGKRGIRPKTAVAFGELKLRTDGSTGVIFSNKKEDEVPFEFNVGRVNPDDDSKFEKLISMGKTTDEWKYIGRANKATHNFIVYYTKDLDAEDLNNATIKQISVDVSDQELEGGNCVWVRPKKENIMEYTICKKKGPGEDAIVKELELTIY